jgi:hypothetical protein
MAWGPHYVNAPQQISTRCRSDLVTCGFNCLRHRQTKWHTRKWKVASVLMHLGLHVTAPCTILETRKQHTEVACSFQTSVNFTTLHGVTSQNMVTFTVTLTRISNFVFSWKSFIVPILFLENPPIFGKCLGTRWSLRSEKWEFLYIQFSWERKRTQFFKRTGFYTTLWRWTKTKDFCTEKLLS